jgi:hypothetical protein
MVNVLGVDIGGVNTKAAIVKTRQDSIQELKIAMEYFPIWKERKNRLPMVLGRLRNQLVETGKLDAVGVTMTAELSDAYWSKREGVDHILDSVSQVFSGQSILVLDVDGKLRSIEEARHEPLKVAAANWVATGWMVSLFKESCIIIDVGSTTTSIIPVIDGALAAVGKTDLDKLINGELVYTGSLRTNVAAIVNFIPIKGMRARVSSELFAQSGDVHLILGNIKEEDYAVETADGRGKTRMEAMARLARVVCADIDMLAEHEVVEIARHVYETQVDQIADGLRQVYDRIRPHLREEIPVIVTGLGRDFLARKAAEKIGFNRIVDLGELTGMDVAIASPAVGVALNVASRLEGRSVVWRRL